jgi:hypothetical protein
MVAFAAQMRTTAARVSPGRYSSPHVVGDFWLDKRPDRRSPLWAIAWYDPTARTVRRKTTGTADLDKAKDCLTRHALTHSNIATGRPVERRQSDKVYFVGGDVGAIKIGLARDVEKRLAEIQAHSPIPVSALAITEGGRGVELAYHRQFAAHRLHGEWFERHPDILAEIERLSSPRAGAGA